MRNVTLQTVVRNINHKSIKLARRETALEGVLCIGSWSMLNRCGGSGIDHRLERRMSLANFHPLLDPTSISKFLIICHELVSLPMSL